MFSKLVFAASVVVLMSGSAMAADAIAYKPQAPVAPVMKANTFSWEGAYAGVNAGYGFGKMKQDDISIKPRGFIGGVQAGYNWQFDQIVAGIEADFQGANIKKGNTISDDAAEQVKVQWFGTVRGRLGANVAERTMLYGTAGLAYGKVKYSEADKEGSSKISKTRAGYTVGAGIEHAFTDNVSLKTEYLYTDLGKVKFTDMPAESGVKTTFQTVRIGVNYKF